MLYMLVIINKIPVLCVSPALKSTGRILSVLSNSLNKVLLIVIITLQPESNYLKV